MNSEWHSDVFLAPTTETSETPAGSWKRRVQRLQKEAHVFYLVFIHRRTPWYAKLVAACTAGYILSPIQLIPNFVPVIGSLDDALILWIGVKLLRKTTPIDVLTECRAIADATESRRKEETGWAIVVAPVVATVWIIAAVTASVLLAVYIRH